MSKTSVVGKFRSLVDRLPRWTAYAGLVVIVVVIYLDDMIGSDFRNYLLPIVVAGVVAFVIHTLFRVDESLSEVTNSNVKDLFPVLRDADSTGLRGVSSPCSDWSPPRAGERRFIAAAGFRIRFITKDLFRQDVERVLRSGGEVVLVMADPRSERVWARYREEPLPKPYGRDGAGKSGQMIGLCGLLYNVHDWREDLAGKGVPVDRLTLKVASNYPTAAYYIMDDDIYTYHYPYRKRGIDGPIFHFDACGSVGQFYRTCLQNIIEDAKVFDDKEFDDIVAWDREHRFTDQIVLGQGKFPPITPGSPTASQA